MTVAFRLILHSLVASFLVKGPFRMKHFWPYWYQLSGHPLTCQPWNVTRKSKGKMILLKFFILMRAQVDNDDVTRICLI